jgi:hypothetical protein
MMRHALCCSVLLATSLAHADDAADIAMARTLGVEGMILADAGKCKDAIEKLTRAEKLHHAPTTATRLGECEIEQGALIAGTERLQRVVHESLPPNAHPAFLAAIARARVSLDRTLPRLASVQVAVQAPDCAHAALTLDNEAVPEAAIDAVRHIDPGAHHLHAEAPGCYPVEIAFDLLEGQTKSLRVDLKVDPVARLALRTRKADDAPATQEIALVAFGVGAVGLVFGVTGGVIVASRTHTLTQTCVNNVCPPEARADIGSAKTWATISTIGFIAAGVGGAAGVALLLTSSKDGEKRTGTRTQAVVGFGTVALQGQF